LADTPSDFDTHLFTPLYVTDDEFALEIATRPSSVMHVSWVQKKRAVIAARWPSWCGRTARWASRTLRRSPRSATSWCIR
jgi:hypothetical protein